MADFVPFGWNFKNKESKTEKKTPDIFRTVSGETKYEYVTSYFEERQKFTDRLNNAMVAGGPRGEKKLGVYEDTMPKGYSLEELNLRLTARKYHTYYKVKDGRRLLFIDLEKSKFCYLL